MNGDGEAAHPRARTGSQHPRTASAPRLTAGTTTPLSYTDFVTPVEDRYFEEYAPGAVYVYGSITMAREDILRFADEFAPQGIHNGPQAARQGPFSGLTASGIEVLDQHGQTVLTTSAMNLVLRRQVISRPG